MARVLRRSGRPVLLVANKVDNDRREADAWELVSLGLGDPWMVSALHGRGTGDLLDEVVRLLPDPSTSPPPDTTTGVDGGAAVGGADGEGNAPGSPSWAGPTSASRHCSTACSGEERSVVHDLPGTTRDAIDTQIDTAEGPIRFIDTAGMRRRSRTEEGTEYYAMVRALQALDHADVVLLVIDATDGVTHQDQRLAERIGASGSPVVIILNKWELLDAEHRRDIVDDVEDRLAFLGDSPVAEGQRPERHGRAQDPPRPGPRRRGLPPPHPHGRAQPGHPLHPERTRRTRGPDPVRGARSHRPAYVHVVRQPPPARAVSALRGAQAARAIRDRAHPGEVPGADRVVSPTVVPARYSPSATVPGGTAHAVV